jgi:protein TonB
MPEMPPPPVVPPTDIPVTPPPPVPQMNVPVVTNAADVLRASGITGVAPTGPGGGGRGTGIGPGDGPGLGPGSNGGTGGKVYGEGSGVINPTLLRQVDPKYTPEAMREKRQGQVVLDCVVLPNGLIDPSSIRVVKSLDRVTGLDQAAIDAAKKWIFRPGTLKGVPVSVQIRLLIEFTLR